jgi:hypothetical protein
MITGENHVDRWGQFCTDRGHSEVVSTSPQSVHMSERGSTLGERTLVHGSTGSTTTE